MATQDDYIRTALRVPPELHAKIHESAKENNRTFNAEIVARLEMSFQEESKTSSAVHANEAVNDYLEQFSRKMEVLALEKEIAFVQLQLRGIHAQIDASNRHLRRQQGYVETLRKKRDSVESTSNVAAWKKLDSEYQSEADYSNELQAGLAAFRTTAKEIQSQLDCLNDRREHLLRTSSN